MDHFLVWGSQIHCNRNYFSVLYERITEAVIEIIQVKQILNFRVDKEWI